MNRRKAIICLLLVLTALLCALAYNGPRLSTSEPSSPAAKTADLQYTGQSLPFSYPRERPSRSGN